MPIDAHLHAFATADEGRLAQGGSPICGYDGTIADLVGILDAGTMDAACVLSALPVALWRDLLGGSWSDEEAPERLLELAMKQNEWLCDATTADPRLLCGVGAEALLPTDPLLRHLSDCLSRHAHVRAIKVHPSLNHVDPADRRYDAVYRLAVDAGVPVFSHGGTSQGTMYASDVEHCHPGKFAPVAAAHPELRLVVAHCAVPFLDELLELGQRHANVYTDLSWVLPARAVEPARLGKFIREFGVERVMFGSDFPFFDPASALEALSETGLSDAELEQVTTGNAARLLWL